MENDLPGKYVGTHGTAIYQCQSHSQPASDAITVGMSSTRASRASPTSDRKHGRAEAIPEDRDGREIGVKTKTLSP